MKLLKQNSKQKLIYITTALNNTVKYYKKLYFENDYYRQKKLMDIEDPNNKDNSESKKKQKLDALHNFFESPFKDDKRYAISYIAQLTRDKLDETGPIVNDLFYDRIFDLLMDTDDERNKLKSFEIMCNLIHSDEQRNKMANENYFKRVYQGIKNEKLDNRTLEKISWMTTLICFYPDMIDQILHLNLLDFIIKISASTYASTIRSNAVLALSLLTYHEKMFDELIRRGVIDLVMELCKDGGDLQVKQFSTLALVHFALNKQSINILIEKGVMDLFSGFASIDNGVIQTNVSWIFLALCNNGITGKTMLENGITRDMFLVSCNPNFNQIRHLVIAGFAELGRCTELRDVEEKSMLPDVQKIKETAIVGMHKNFRVESEQTIDILLRFTVSDNEIYKVISYWALKDYILLNHDNLIKDLTGVIQAFVNGCIYSQEEVNTECANAISFLITHHLVYKDTPPLNQQTQQLQDQSVAFLDKSGSNNILDALMHLTGSSSKFIRTRAFSTLSTLSTYASASQNIMEQIGKDIKLPQNKISKQYYQFIMQRLNDNLNQFQGKFISEAIEDKFAGLFCLLRIAKDPSQMVIEESATKLYEFIFGKKHNIQNEPLNEAFFIYVFHALKFTKNVDILMKILKVIKFYINFKSPLQQEVINPDTILWLLETIEQHRSKKVLGCRASRTLLEIVSVHQIVFDYQEVAIIKKFNQALQNLDVFDSLSSQHNVTEERIDAKKEKNPRGRNNTVLSNSFGLPLEEEKEKGHEIKIVEELSEKSKEEENQIESLKDDSEMEDLLEENKDEPDSKSQKIIQIFGETFEENAQQQIADKVSEHDKSLSQKQSLIQLEEEDQILKENELLAETNDNDLSNKAKRQDSQGLKRRANAKPEFFQSQSQDSSSQIVNRLSSLKESIVKQTSILGTKHLYSQSTQKRNIPMFSDQASSLASINSSKNILAGGEAFERQSRQINQTLDDYDDKDQDAMTTMELDNQDEEAMELIMRDSLIKSFMVIFTHDHSQHLLLNKDLIDIAFNCLEFCSDISIEAKQKLAKLISIIFKFPQVQEKLLSQEVIIGMSHLLEQTEDLEILKNTVKACTYLSMNYEFVSTHLSLEILKNLMPLLDLFQDTDKLNLIFSITNILKGSKQNKQYFFDNKGSTIFLQAIIDSQDSKLIEMCISSIKELTAYKQSLKGLLDRDQNMLKNIFIKCLDISDDWREKQIQYRKAVIEERKGNSGNDDQDDQHDEIQPQANAQNLMKIIAQDEGDDKKTTLFAHSIVQIRSNIYFSISRCIKAGLSLSFLKDQCNFTQRLLKDLAQQDENSYIFENLLLALNSIECDPNYINTFLSENCQQLVHFVYDYQIQDNRVSLLKVLINLCLNAVDLLCINQELFYNLFLMIEKHSDEEVQENIIWLVSAMIEQTTSPNIVRVCSQCNIMITLAKCLSSTNQRIILQALKTLAITAVEGELLSQFQLTQSLHLLLKISQTKFQKYNLEIKTALNELLVVLTNDNTSFRAELVENGFLNYLIEEAASKPYVHEKQLGGEEQLLDMDINEEDLKSDHKAFSSIENGNPFQLNELLQGNLNEDFFDDIERLPNSNLMIESIIQTLSNISIDANSHVKLIDLGIIILAKRMIDMLQSQKDNEQQEVDMGLMSIGCIKLFKSLSLVLQNLSVNAEMQEQCLRNGMIGVLSECLKLRDYDVLTNVHMALGSFILSKNDYVKKKSVEFGCLDLLLDSNEESPFLRIRRICSQILSNTEAYLFDYNETVKNK